MVRNESLTSSIAEDWKTTPYYEDAEQPAWLEPFWTPDTRFRRKFDRLDPERYVELACGRGRHTNYVLKRIADPRVRQVWLVDVNEDNVAACARRFADDPRVECLRNNGSDLAALRGNCATALFSYDAMVHFEYDTVLLYLEDVFRVLAPGGRALLHHSNFDRNPGAHYQQNPHWRNFMTKNLFAHAAMRTGFAVLEQEVTNWNREPDLDCISLIEKPA